MKITLNWLRKYTDYTGTPDELKEALTMMGMEVEGMETVSAGFDNIVVGQILASEPHPNADKLSVNRVNVGKEERTIVCGAKNFKVGDKVPVALPGCTMPVPAEDGKPITIKVGKLRGVESQGMMCSARELGLSQDHSGLMLLPETATVGQPFAEYLGRGTSDIVYDLEITPNRPDLNSLIGIAREVSALTGNPLRIPEIPAETIANATDNAESVSKYVDVRLEDTQLCPRYVARVIRGVKVGPSPDWLKESLEKIGVRSINNVVDVTNYVMMEVGQPLHAFDYHLLQKKEGAATPVIVVRHATEGESFTTLDDRKHTLTSAMQVIADETKATALAGVMGGLNTEINDQTVDVLLESAYFNPQNVRATSKKLAIRTDASYRYERGADINVCDYASQRAVQLIIETAGGKLCQGVIDVFPTKPTPKQITLRYAKTNALLGLEIPGETQKQYLASLQLTPVDFNDTQVTVQIPSYRVDLKREVDLIEEVGRLHGVDKIPSTLKVGSIGSNAYDATVDALNQARSILCSLGIYEAQGQTLISGTSAKVVCDNPVPLNNPLSSDMDVLRPSLLPGLLTCLTHNINHGINDVALFEIGKTFSQDNDGKLGEQRRLAIAMTGNRKPTYWTGAERDAKLDIFDLKGILEDFIEQFGIRGAAFSRATVAHPLFMEWGKISQGKLEIARFGQLKPNLARKIDLRDPVLLAEWNMDILLARRNPSHSFKSINSLPSSRRDVAMLVDNNITHETILVAIKKAKIPFLENVELFDIFKGKGVPEGSKSMAYAFTYRNSERTLTDNEVNASHKRVIEALQQSVHATIR